MSHKFSNECPTNSPSNEWCPTNSPRLWSVASKRWSFCTAATFITRRKTIWWLGYLALRRLSCWPWASQGVTGRPWTPLIVKLLAKKFVFSIWRGKNQISPFLAPPGKHFGKITYCPLQIVGIAVCTRGVLVVAQSCRVHWLGVFFFGWSTWN